VDGASGLKLSVTQDPGAGGVLGGFQAQFNSPDASENPAFPDGTLCVNVLGVREMDFPVTDPDLDNAAGSATFGGSDAAGVDWPVDLGHALIRMTGSASQQCKVDSTVTSLSDTEANSLETPEVVSQVVQRGDARADGEVNMADARSIAQYLVGSRLACTTEVDVECLHSVNAASVKPDGEADGKSAADALLIAQQLVGLRDEYYNLAP
jgi:hypothetical protein